MSLSRRGFIKGVAAGSVAVAGTAKAGGGVTRFPGYEGSYGLLHDTTRCIGCRSCEAACKQVNELPPSEVPIDDKSIFDTQRRTTETSLTVVNRFKEEADGKPAVYRKHQCMHCQEPCCASVCFVQAFTKTPEGPVLYDPSVCVGCRYCVMACPYYALAYEFDEPLTPRVMRCTMCYPRIKEGKNPGCADACPTGAITFGRRDELLEVARDRIRKNPEKYINHVFGEHEFGGTSWLVLAGERFKALGLPEDVSQQPLPDLMSGFLSVVPLVISIYPGLLLGFYSWSKRREEVSEQERRDAVAEAQARAEDENKQKLAAAADKAKKDKEKAVEMAVKKAVAEAQKGGEP